MPTTLSTQRARPLPLSLLPVLLVATLASTLPEQRHAAAVTLRVHSTSPPAAMTAPAFLGMNIDAASLYQGARVNLSDPTLRFLARRLGEASSEPMTLRVGGSAADDLGFGASTSQRIVLDLATWDELVDFAAQAGLRLAFDLNALRMRMPDGRWNETDARVLLTRARDMGQPIWAVQLGNEPGHFLTRTGNVTAKQHGRDFVQLAALLDGLYGQQHNTTRPRLQGPDVCFGQMTQTSPCADESYMSELLVAAAASAAVGSGTAQAGLDSTQPSSLPLDDLTVHDYGLQGPKGNATGQCTLGNFTDPAGWEADMLPVLHQWATLHKAQAPHARLVLSEFATTGDGGCPGLSNTFVTGFFFVDAIGMVAKAGYWQAYRQDLVGFSGIGVGSSYALAGEAGWQSEPMSGPLRPNPDWFTALLWRTLMGPVLLQSSVGNSVNSADDASAASRLRFHAGCTQPGAAYEAGAVTVAFALPPPASQTDGYPGSSATAAAAATAVNVSFDLQLPRGAKPLTAHVYALTSSASGLASRDVVLNGASAPLDASSPLPPKAHTFDPSSTELPTLVLPASSYGFVVFPDASVAQCVEAVASTSGG